MLCADPPNYVDRQVLALLEPIVTCGSACLLAPGRTPPMLPRPRLPGGDGSPIGLPRQSV